MNKKYVARVVFNEHFEKSHFEIHSLELVFDPSLRKFHLIYFYLLHSPFRFVVTYSNLYSSSVNNLFVTELFIIIHY